MAAAIQILTIRCMEGYKIKSAVPLKKFSTLIWICLSLLEILQQMLSTVLNILMFEDCRNQWSMSRPLLGLILLNEDYFQSLRDQVRKNTSQVNIVKSCPNGKKSMKFWLLFSTLWHFLVTFGQFLYLYLASFCIIKAISDNPKAKCHKYNGYPWISKKTFLS